MTRILAPYEASGMFADLEGLGYRDEFRGQFPDRGYIAGLLYILLLGFMYENLLKEKSLRESF